MYTRGSQGKVLVLVLVIWRSTKGKAGAVLWRKRWSGCGCAERRGCRASGRVDGTSKQQNLSFTRRIWGLGRLRWKWVGGRCGVWCGGPWMRRWERRVPELGNQGENGCAALEVKTKGKHFRESTCAKGNKDRILGEKGKKVGGEVNGRLQVVASAKR
jgi:hypothetical protein